MNEAEAAFIDGYWNVRNMLDNLSQDLSRPVEPPAEEPEQEEVTV